MNTNLAIVRMTRYAKDDNTVCSSLSIEMGGKTLFEGETREVTRCMLPQGAYISKAVSGETCPMALAVQGKRGFRIGTARTQREADMAVAGFVDKPLSRDLLTQSDEEREQFFDACNVIDQQAEAIVIIVR